MKNKGLTLIEMLIVMAFLGLILLVVFPNVSGMMKKTSDNKYEAFKSNLFLATEAYVQKNIDLYPELKENNGSCEISVSSLIKAKYIKSNLKDPSTNEEVSNLTYKIKVTKIEDKGYNYELIK